MSTKGEIFDYVIHSPENTNPAVLGSMLNSLVHDVMAEAQNGKPMPILKLPYDRPSIYTNACDCRFIGKDSSPDAQRETLMWTLITKTEGIQTTGKGYFYSTIQNEPSNNSIKIYYIIYVYNAYYIRLKTK